MKKNLIIFCAVLCASILAIWLLLTFRIIPTTKIWDKYNILYVDNSIEVELIKNKLESIGITGVLYPDHTVFPVPSPLAPVQHHVFASNISHEDLQTVFFTDSSKNFTLYYIPQDFLYAIPSAFSGDTFAWGLDAEGNMPFLPFFITTLYLCLIVFFAKHKILFSTVQFPLILYTFICPYYHIAACVCFFATVNYVTIDNYIYRKNFSNTLYKNIFFTSALVLLFISSLLISFKSFLLLLITIILSCSLSYMYYCIEVYIYRNTYFKPVLIHSTKTKKEAKNSLYIIPTAMLLLFSLAMLSVLNVSSSQNNNQSILQFPAPSGYTIDTDFSTKSYEKTVENHTGIRLPDLTDFISTTWHFEMFPFVRLTNKLTKTVLPGQTITTTEYIKDGYALQVKTKELACFNDDYIAKTIETIKKTNNAGAEKLLASQKGFSQVAYAKSGTLSAPNGSVIVYIVVGAYIISMFTVFIVKRKKRYGTKV